MQILLSHIVLSLYHPLTTPGEEDALPLAHVVRLHYKSFRSLVIKLIFETLGVGRENPGLREKVKVVG